MPKLGDFLPRLRKYAGKDLDNWLTNRGLKESDELTDKVIQDLYYEAAEKLGPDEAADLLLKVGILKDVRRLKLFISGNGGVGKTSFCRRFALGVFDKSYKMTIGVDFYSKDMVIDGTLFKLVIWDMAGQERFGFMRPAFYKGCSGGFIAFSLVDDQSIKDVPGWVKEAENNIGRVPLVLVGTKRDLGISIGVNPTKLAEELGFDGYIETSALSGENIEEAVRLLVRKINAKTQFS